MRSRLSLRPAKSCMAPRDLFSLRKESECPVRHGLGSCPMCSCLRSGHAVVGLVEAPTASQASLPSLALPRSHGYLERSWEEPRLSTGEMLAEWAEWAEGRWAACLLGDVDCDRALALVRDRERRFFFFSWGLLKEKCSCQVGNTKCSTRGQSQFVSRGPPHRDLFLSFGDIFWDGFEN